MAPEHKVLEFELRRFELLPDLDEDVIVEPAQHIGSFFAFGDFGRGQEATFDLGQ